MPTGSGISGQLGLKEESAWGTPVVVDRFYELLSENIQAVPTRVESNGIRSGQRLLRSDDWTTGVTRVSGPLEFELSTKNIALLMKHIFGSLVTTGAGPYTHTFTPGDLTAKGLTVQVGRPSSDGTVQPFTFAGGKVAGWEVGFALDEVSHLNLDMVFKSQTTATALATANYTASNALLAFVHGSLTIGGATAKVQAGTISGTTPMNTDRIFLGASTIDEPLENARRDITFDFGSEFDGLTGVNRIINGTEAALVLAFTRGADSITFTTNGRFDTGMPNLDSLDILDMPLAGKIVATGADSTGITCAVVSGEATP